MWSNIALVLLGMLLAGTWAITMAVSYFAGKASVIQKIEDTSRDIDIP